MIINLLGNAGLKMFCFVNVYSSFFNLFKLEVKIQNLNSTVNVIVLGGLVGHLAHDQKVVGSIPVQC